MIVPLQHISATEMAGVLKPVAPESAFVRVDGKRNLLILAGTQLQLEGWLDIVATFDIDQLAGTSVGVFPITQGEVLEVHKEILHILRAKDDKEDVGLSAMVSVLPVERLNSLLVVSPRSEYVERVGAWITELDTIEVSTSEISLHVYEVQNGNAANLASLLETIYGEGGGKKRSSEVAPGMRSQTSGSGGGSTPGTVGQAAGGSNFSLGESVKVVSDVYNNSLLVYASSYEYSKIEKILKKLDVTATQVLIEASIVEVTLTDDLQYGLEWTFQNGIGSDYQGEGSLNLSGGEIGPTAPGFAYTVTNQAGFTKAVLNALAEKSLLNVISTPSVLVLDNHTASIQVGIQQPIQSRQSVTDGGVSQTSIEYKDTGVKLQVTPSVNDGGLVTLEVSQSVTDVGNIDLATRQRSFNERSVSSKVAVRDGDSVVLGGLIRDNASSGKSGIPLLMDIPVVGNLFSTTVDTSIRTELLIFITPRVLESDKDLRGVTAEMRTRMRGLKDFSDLPNALRNPTAEVE
jgi:general secretion pathway protein D